MRFITLHNDMSPDQDVFVDADTITSIIPFGSGSSINGNISVHETPDEVEAIIKGV
jgi:hypothetical protein